ncbi:diacylglycerol lipase-alpha [Nilaparvata lugens]|uniref:diacylglycerol lipase-alpha n=1 Tax=Nilaparvata lugens TaxID=108931 RepID=UPI00193D5585|nr:diacylglycerol lipase-alpha [Nilaparvata lugens]
MPGLVAFRRRWSVGSDDLVVPGVLLFLVHFIWLIVLCGVLYVVEFDLSMRCIWMLWQHCLGYALILLGSAVLDLMISFVAMRGGILEVEARAPMRYLIYLRLGVMVIEMIWLTLAVIWLSIHYQGCPIEGAKEVFLGMVICSWLVVLSVILTAWCAFDSAGRSWVKMKKFQRSMKESESRFQYKRSGNRTRNWRQRKVLRAYQDSWDHRCRLLFCCMRNSDRNKNSFADIARLLSDFFRDLDVVPSDVIAGLVLLRKFQKIEREAIVSQRKNDTYRYLSGVAVTSKTRFLPLGDAQYYQHFQAVIHYMHYALAAYGWPMFLLTHSPTGICQLCTKLRCACFSCCCGHNETDEEPVVVEDNCCNCNYAALHSMVSAGDVSIEYATYHVDVGETPFFVAIDYKRRKVVLSIRGTLSMKDVITDLNAESETLPLTPPREDWLGHKGMVHAAVYIRDKLSSESILTRALSTSIKKSGEPFSLVLVGHSLGAGTAAILAILLRQSHPDLQCFAYSPPGGLLRLQWKTISCSVLCCGCAVMPTSAVELKADPSTVQEYQREKDSARAMAIHPTDSSIALTLHQPLYPPGSIIHVVRHHPTKTEQRYEKKWRQVLKKHDPVYQALWANNTDFDEVLISPVMIQDHMPDKVLDALNKVITSLGPAKPQRVVNNNNNNNNQPPMDAEHCHLLAGSSTTTPPAPPPHRLCLETSFTSLKQKPCSASATAVPESLSTADSKHLPWEFASLVPQNSSQIDLIHDDWFGLAPLATPESLSEVSSISSRASGMVTGQHVTMVSHEHKILRFPHRATASKNSSSDRFFSAESFGSDNDNKRWGRVFPEVVTESTESSPLLSSLHLLSDERFAPLMKGISSSGQISISSGSFESASCTKVEEENNSSTTTDSVLVNAEVHEPQIDDRPPQLWTEEIDLLEDIEQSLKLTCNISGFRDSLKRESEFSSREHSNASPSEDNDKNKFMYPILFVGHGESSV